MGEGDQMEIHAMGDWITQTSEAWGALVQDAGAARIYPDSELDNDAVLPGRLVPAHLAWRSIATAGEHLGALYHLHSTSDSGVWVKPYLSLARATLLGAARALYVLEPEDANYRRAHSLQLLRSEAEDLHRVVGDWERASEDTLLNDVRREADAFRAETERELVRSGMKSGSIKSETALLLDVAHHLSDGADDPVASIMDVWRLASGTAHARTWPWESGFEDQEALHAYVRIWSVPLGLLGHAWELWNRRRGES